MKQTEKKKWAFYVWLLLAAPGTITAIAAKSDLFWAGIGAMVLSMAFLAIYQHANE